MADTAPEATPHTGAEPGEGAPDGPPEGVPWISPEIQQRIGWRDGDVVVSVPPKSGTTWTMNIVHQLREGGDVSFRDIYVEVPWIEFVPTPESTIDRIVADIDAMGHHRRRAFKTHSGPGELPYLPPEKGPDVRYVVVMRHPDEAVASFHPFLLGHSDEFFALWGMPREMIAPDLPTFFEEIGGMMLSQLFGFVAAWWPLRHAENVCFVHYADLKDDPEREIRRIADCLDMEVAEQDWPAIVEYTSFGWMKANEDRFELRGLNCGVPVLQPGAMVRRGRKGAAAEDGITPQMSAAIAALGAEIVEDPEALRWLYEGGPLPE